jgi:hypothetical protein
MDIIEAKKLAKEVLIKKATLQQVIKMELL